MCECICDVRRCAAWYRDADRCARACSSDSSHRTQRRGIHIFTYATHARATYKTHFMYSIEPSSLLESESSSSSESSHLLLASQSSRFSLWDVMRSFGCVCVCMCFFFCLFVVVMLMWCVWSEARCDVDPDTRAMLSETRVRACAARSQEAETPELNPKQLSVCECFFIYCGAGGDVDGDRREGVINLRARSSSLVSRVGMCGFGDFGNMNSPTPHTHLQHATTRREKKKQQRTSNMFSECMISAKRDRRLLRHKVK